MTRQIRWETSNLQMYAGASTPAVVANRSTVCLIPLGVVDNKSRTRMRKHIAKGTAP